MTKATRRWSTAELDTIRRNRNASLPNASPATKARAVRPAKRSGGPRISEHAEQVAVIQWWASYCGTVGLDERLLFAIPNGGARSAVTGAMLKAEGVRAGVLDLFLALPYGLMWPARSRCGLWIELKAIDGKATPEQEGYILLLCEQGYATRICFGADDAIGAIKTYCECALA